MNHVEQPGFASKTTNLNALQNLAAETHVSCFELLHPITPIVHSVIMGVFSYSCRLEPSTLRHKPCLCFVFIKHVSCLMGPRQAATSSCVCDGAACEQAGCPVTTGKGARCKSGSKVVALHRKYRKIQKSKRLYTWVYLNVLWSFPTTYFGKGMRKRRQENCLATCQCSKECQGRFSQRRRLVWGWWLKKCRNSAQISNINNHGTSIWLRSPGRNHDLIGQVQVANSRPGHS